MSKTKQEQGIRENIQAQLESLEEDRKKVRFRHSLVKFNQGDFGTLKNDEFVQGLTLSFRKENFPEQATLNDTLESLMAASFDSDPEIRQRVLPVLYQAANFFLSLDHTDGILCIQSIMLEWLRSETDTLAGTETITKKIEECIAWLLSNNKLDFAEEPMLYYIRYMPVEEVVIQL